jgi:hypothetical protein
MPKDPSNTQPEEAQRNAESLTAAPKRTPLPKLQVFILLLIQFSEPVTGKHPPASKMSSSSSRICSLALVIYPFVIQFVRDTGVTGGDESKTGYFAGIIVRLASGSGQGTASNKHQSRQESVFFLAECLTVVYFGRASDRYGRRPVLLLGPVGLAIAMLGFGHSKRFWSLVVFRCLQGAFNGNIGEYQCRVRH